jgi:hypothetical protein
MLKTNAAFVIALALAGNIAAQDKPAADPPDYSPKKLIQIFADDPARQKVDPNVSWGLGYVDFKALNLRWRFGYPVLPLSGSLPFRNGAFGSLPDPFKLTRTELPWTPSAGRQTRDMGAELMRIERNGKTKVRVTVKPE